MVWRSATGPWDAVRIGGGSGLHSVELAAAPAGCSVECRAPAEFSSPCGGRGPAVDIRYANEAGCIELVLLEIKGTNSNPKHLHSVCMHQPTNPPSCTKSSSRQSSSRLMRSQIPSLPVSLLAACKIKHISGEESWAEVPFGIQSSF